MTNTTNILNQFFLKYVETVVTYSAARTTADAARAAINASMRV